jgi:hypothetical protein
MQNKAQRVDFLARSATLEGVRAWWATLTGEQVFAAAPHFVDTEDVTGLQSDDGMRALMAIYLDTNPDAVDDLAAPEYSRLRTLIAHATLRAADSSESCGDAAQDKILHGGDAQFVESFRSMTGRQLRCLPTGPTLAQDPTGRATKVFYEALAARCCGVSVSELRGWRAPAYLAAIKAAHAAFFCSARGVSETSADSAPS